MVTQLLRRVGFRGWHFHVLSLGSVGLCIALWIRAKTVDDDMRGNAERRAIFVGLWAPTLWLIGDGVERRESLAERVGRRSPGRSRLGRTLARR